MWGGGLWICHMFVCGLGSVWLLERFLGSVWVWHMGFSPHAVHGAMFEDFSCVCKDMYHLLFLPQVF